MIIDIIVIFKLYLIFSFHSVFGAHVRIRTPYIPLDQIFIIYKSIIQMTITLFIINVMNNSF